jgi:hypothetical protein
MSDKHMLYKQQQAGIVPSITPIYCEFLLAEKKMKLIHIS